MEVRNLISKLQKGMNTTTRVFFTIDNSEKEFEILRVDSYTNKHMIVLKEKEVDTDFEEIQEMELPEDAVEHTITKEESESIKEDYGVNVPEGSPAYKLPNKESEELLSEKEKKQEGVVIKNDRPVVDKPNVVKEETKDEKEDKSITSSSPESLSKIKSKLNKKNK